MDRSDAVAAALSSSHAMLDAAKREDWEDAMRFAGILMEQLSDASGNWSFAYQVEQTSDAQNILLNLREALERMQGRRDELQSLLGDMRVQQRLRASYHHNE